MDDIWHAHERPAADVDAELGHVRACKAMRHVGFGGADEPVDEDLRAAWRDRLAREGKLGGRSVRELLQS